MSATSKSVRRWRRLMSGKTVRPLSLRRMQRASRAAARVGIAGRVTP